MVVTVVQQCFNDAPHSGLGREKFGRRFLAICRMGVALLFLCAFAGHADQSVVAPVPVPEFDALATLDPLQPPQQSSGVRLERVRAVWAGRRGTLAVGKDWSNFQDFPLLTEGNGGASTYAAPLLGENSTTEQITWNGRNGFSVSLEEPGDGAAAANDNIESLQALADGSPSLIVSWQGGEADEAGQYKVSALGRRLDLKGAHNGVAVDDSKLGWGVNLAGGWRFGDLFAALSVTLGNGIDSLILKRFGSDVAVSSSGQAKTLESISILPRLSYSLNKHSNFHIELGRYQAGEDGEEVTGIDTLDTINLGYTWSPWPSAEFEVEVVGQNLEGTLGGEDSTAIQVGAKKRF